MYCLNSRNKKLSKSGHPIQKTNCFLSDQKSEIFDKMQIPIMLCFKARGIRTAPPGNSYNYSSKEYYIKPSVMDLAWK